MTKKIMIYSIYLIGVEKLFGIIYSPIDSIMEIHITIQYLMNLDLKLSRKIKIMNLNLLKNINGAKMKIFLFLIEIDGALIFQKDVIGRYLKKWV